MTWRVRRSGQWWAVTRPDGTWSGSFIHWPDALTHATHRAATWNAVANAVANLSHYERGQALEMLKQLQGRTCTVCMKDHNQ